DATVVPRWPGIPRLFDRTQELVHLGRVHGLGCMIVILAWRLTREDARVPLRAVDLRVGFHPLLVGMPPARFDHAVRPGGPSDQQDAVVIDGIRAVPRPDGSADPLGGRVAQDE